MKKLWAFHGLRTGILVALLAVAVAGATLAIKAPSAPSAHAAGVGGGGGCGWSDYTASYGVWHTELCVNGPYYSSGNEYFTYEASCWVNSAAANQGFLEYQYFLGCTVQDEVGSHLYPMGQIHSPAYLRQYTPATVLSLAEGERTTKLYTYIDIWINGNSYINEIGGDTYAPPNGSAYISVYLP